MTTTVCCGGVEKWGLVNALRSKAHPMMSGRCAFGKNSLHFGRLLGQSAEHSNPPENSPSMQVKVRVAADYSDSKPDAFKQRGKWDYHPSEDFTKLEKEKMEQIGEKKLTDAEMARTISEVNWSAFIFSSVVSGRNSLFGTEVSFLVDDQGDFYFEVEDENEFLESLNSTQIFTVLIGFENVDGILFSELDDPESEIEVINLGDVEGEEEERDSSDNESAEVDLEFWDGIIEARDDYDDVSADESFSSVGGWGGSETLEDVHPMDFAFKMCECVSTDYAAEIDKPGRRLTITGVVRRVTEEEEPYVQGVWFDRFFNGDDAKTDDSDSGLDNGDAELGVPSVDNLIASVEHDNAVNSAAGSRLPVKLPQEPASTIESPDADMLTISSNGAPCDRSLNGSFSTPHVEGLSDRMYPAAQAGKLNEGDSVVGEWSEQTSFYRLDIIQIQLDISPGVKSTVQVRDYIYAEPDVLAHFAPAIIERINAGGKKTQCALKALCQRLNGLNAEEVSLVGVDCLGVDLRVQCGIEVQTVRVAFSRRATCEASAEQLLDHLLYPRVGHRRSKRKGPQWKAR